jgi:pyridinium-3,5-bisthiocarboxylic acid mononucleotide nickel chelatase
MRIAYLDCFSGISGDMFLGALLDAGVPARLLEETVAKLDVGARVEVHRVRRGGLSATKVDVFAGGEKDMPREQYWREREARKHHAHVHEHEHQHARHLSEIRTIIERAAIGDGAKRTAIRVFEKLGAVEAKIHDTDIESVHFHETGAVDAIVDIVGAAVGAEALGVDAWYCSPLNVGGGTVKCAHGEIPIPAPATLALLKDAPIYGSDVQAELVTPTGAAIVATLASRFVPLPPMKVEQIGYGAGTREFESRANVVRLTVGEAAEELATASLHGAQQDTVAVIEANLDDLTPEVFGYVMDRLFAEGALDVFAVPVQMKKNRPGTLLTVLAPPAEAERLVRTVFAESTTLGVRVRQEQRHVLPRRSVTVATPWGDVRMKVANLNGTIANVAPEYEDCRKIAAEHQIPLKQVMQAAVAEYETQRRHGGTEKNG